MTDAVATDLRRSRGWTVGWRLVYAILRVLDPILRVSWWSGGMGITSRLSVRGRRSGRSRSVLVGLLRVEDRLYVGHPNGEVDWTRNLDAARMALIKRPGLPELEMRAVRLPHGRERAAAIGITAQQQPFPGNVLYAAARRHILAVGVYFRLEPMDPS